MDDNDESENEHAENTLHEPVQPAAVVPTPPPPAPIKPAEEDHLGSKEPPKASAAEHADKRRARSPSPTKAPSGKLKQSTLAPTKGATKSVVGSFAKPPTKEAANEKSKEVPKDSANDSAKKTPQPSPAARAARNHCPSPSPERPGVSPIKASKSLVANRAISGPTLAGEAVPVEIPPDTTATPKATTASMASKATASVVSADYIASAASAESETVVSAPSNPSNPVGPANGPDGSDDSDAESAQPCPSQAKKPTGTLSDSGSDCGSDVDTGGKLSEKDIESRVRQDDTLAAMEIEEAESREHASNRQREKESAEEDGRDMDDDDDDEDQGEGTNPRAKKARRSEDGSVPNGSKGSKGKASQRGEDGNNGDAKRHASAGSKEGAAKRQKKDAIEIPKDRDLLQDTKTESFDKVRLMVINKRTGKKAERMLFDVKEMAALEGATLTKYEKSSSDLLNAIADNTPPEEDLRAKIQWSSEGVIQAYPLSANDLLIGVTNEKLPDFVTNVKEDQNAVYHLLAASVVWKRKGDNEYSVMLRVAPTEPVKTGNAEEDTRNQLFYDGLVELQKQDPHMELLMSIGDFLIKWLVKQPNSGIFLPNLICVCVKGHGTALKKQLGPGLSKIKFSQFHECPKDAKVSSLVIPTEESQPKSGRRKQPAASKSSQADGGSTDDTVTVQEASDPVVHGTKQRGGNKDKKTTGLDKSGKNSSNSSKSSNPGGSEESVASAEQPEPTESAREPAPPPPTPAAPVAPVAPVAPAASIAPVSTSVAAPTQNGLTSQQAAPETSIAFYDSEEEGMSMIAALGLVEGSAEGSGYKRVIYSGDGVDAQKLPNGRWMFLINSGATL